MSPQNFIELRHSRITRIVESLSVIGLHTRVNHHIFFHYKMAPNQLKILSNVVSAVLLLGYLDISFGERKS